MRHQWTALYIFFQIFSAPHPVLLEHQLHILLDHLILSQCWLRLRSLESLSVNPIPLPWESSKFNCVLCSGGGKLKSHSIFPLFQLQLFSRILRVSLHIYSSGWAKDLRGVYRQISWLTILWFLFLPSGFPSPLQFSASLANSNSNISSQFRLSVSVLAAAPHIV